MTSFTPTQTTGSGAFGPTVTAGRQPATPSMSSTTDRAPTASTDNESPLTAWIEASRWTREDLELVLEVLYTLALVGSTGLALYLGVAA
ncbi:hypothetical protein [Halomarina oriensis]|uniref:Uncharacterized protein n=1 Tax=Halomarina oriensis TaxID=671145 RepID=A0A6B0GE48_9EURY|nr:hypothetical protein [Halomarina oriensis]MWG32974.1 hypothetical protein [Halomarina oriensis]